MVLANGICRLCGAETKPGERRITKYCPSCREHVKPIDTTCHAMLCRVRDAHMEKFKMYRGIKVCKEWDCGDHHIFILWSLSHGWSPGKVLDRIDGTKDYCPENCRWVTAQQNSQNRLYHATNYAEGKRKCWCCQRILLLTEFQKSPDDSTGRRRICPMCASQKQRERKLRRHS